MKKFELIPASRATRNGTNITSSSGDENVFQPIRFVIFDNEYVNRGLPVLETARGLDSWRRPEGSRPIGTRMLHLQTQASET